MEQIGKVIDKAQQDDKTQQPQDKQRSSDHSKTMLVMWTAMSHAFGSSWVSQYGTSEESAFRSWSKALDQYTPEQIKRGVKNSVDPNMWEGSFPPNLSEFCKLCLTVNREYAVPYHKPLQIERDVTKSSREIIEKAKQGAENQTFQEAYEFLGLHTRWGPLSEERLKDVSNE